MKRRGKILLNKQAGWFIRQIFPYQTPETVKCYTACPKKNPGGKPAKAFLREEGRRDEEKGYFRG